MFGFIICRVGSEFCTIELSVWDLAFTEFTTEDSRFFFTDSSCSLLPAQSSVGALVTCCWLSIIWFCNILFIFLKSHSLSVNKVKLSIIYSYTVYYMALVKSNILWSVWYYRAVILNWRFWVNYYRKVTHTVQLQNEGDNNFSVKKSSIFFVTQKSALEPCLAISLEKATQSRQGFRLKNRHL